jgi:thiamine kinase-like enzyme
LRLARIAWSNNQLENIISNKHFLAFEEFVIDWCQGGEYQIVHGDFQNKNILLRDRELVVIDPAPAISDPLMDIASWLLIFNPTNGVENRAEIISELLGLDLDRLMVWIRVQATYSTVFATPQQRPDYIKYHLQLREL